MYSADAIQTIVDRIGWSRPLELTDIVLTNANLTSTSGRTFESFHHLVTVTNVKDCVPDPNTSNTILNDELYKFKTQAVLAIFNAIFDKNELAYYQENSRSVRVDVSQLDYSDKIVRFKSVFDEAYGLQVAVDVLEMMKGTARSNKNERTIRASIPEIDAALHGLYDVNNGKYVTKGLLSELQHAIKEAIKILFPALSTGKRYIQNASYKW